ncbi:flippase [Candidatus Zixiibacteriota bacterium]
MLSTVGRVARNSIAVIGALLIKRATNLVLFVLIARHLGVLAFGQFSLVYTFYIIFQVSAAFGLANLIAREVAKDKSDLDKYLLNGHFIVLLASLISLAVWILMIHLLDYSQEVVRASYLLGLALIPFTMSKVCEAIFQAYERMQFMTYAFGLANLTKIGLVWLLLSQGYGLMHIIGLLVIIQTAMLLMEWGFISRYFSKPSWTIDLAFCRKLARVSITFLGIGLFTVIFLRLNIIILSKFRGETDVGLYNAAFQLTYVFMLISMSLKQAVYPVLSRTYTANLAKFKQYSERSIEFLMSIAFPLAVYFFFLANSILLIYKKDFVAAGPTMQVLGWMLVPMSFSRILGSILMASGRQRSNLVIAMVNTASLLILSLVLIHYFGLIGAGVALLASHVISFILHYSLVTGQIFRISIPRMIWKPGVASLIMAGVLMLIGRDQGLSLLIPSTAIIYVAVLLSLNFLFGGPFKSMKIGMLVGRTEPEIPGTET